MNVDGAHWKVWPALIVKTPQADLTLMHSMHAGMMGASLCDSIIRPLSLMRPVTLLCCKPQF